MLELEKINEILGNFEKLPTVADRQDKGYWSERYDGGIAERVIIKDLKSVLGQDTNIFLKVTKQTDSYGDNESVKSLKFVEQKTKTIEVYE